MFLAFTTAVKLGKYQELVHTLKFRRGSMGQAYNEKVEYYDHLESLANMLPNLRTFDGLDDARISGIFVDRLPHSQWNNLTIVKITLDDLANLDYVLKLPALKELELDLKGSSRDQANGLKKKPLSKKKALDKITIRGNINNLLHTFLFSIEATEVHLQGVDKIESALLWIQPLSTARLIVEGYGGGYRRFILDQMLLRFTNLQHLELDGFSSHFSKTFWTTFLTPKSNLVSLSLGKDFELIADDLGRALKDEKAAPKLKEIRLDVIDVTGGEPHLFDTRGIVEPGWTDDCSFEQASLLQNDISIRGIKLKGSFEDAILRQYDYEDYQVRDPWNDDVEDSDDDRKPHDDDEWSY
jgi:hypothetical protein